MEDLIKYVLGVAAKSNVEQRQVGCVIVDSQENIIAEGFNSEFPAKDQPVPYGHAEAMACEHMCAQALDIGEQYWYTAYVTHQPCPTCAKLLKEYGVKEVIIVDAFMKFDGDKIRLDLIDGKFAQYVIRDTTWPKDESKADNIKYALWMYSAGQAKIITAIDFVCSKYANFLDMEEHLAKVLTFGARKYKPNNWRNCTDTGRYLAAAHRHLNAIVLGEVNDPETGFNHYDHVMCNLMFLYVLGLKTS